MNVLLWFKRDLRLADHPAFTRAAGLGPVLPLYIAEPGLWQLPDASARQWQGVADALEDLRRDLGSHGMPLILRTGDAVEVLSRLCRLHRISRIVSHEETGNLWSYARDRRVAVWARSAGVVWDELPQCGVVRRLASRDGWATARDAYMAQPVLAPPAAQPVAGLAGGEGLIPSARALGLAPDPCPHRPAGGRAQALVLMDSFLDQRAALYHVSLSSPLTAVRACSRLSPHLATGALSVREVVQATAARARQRPGGSWGKAMAAFQARLAWRDHFIQKLEDEPAIETRDLHSGALPRPRDTDATRLAAWEAGETGFPYLDACMRSLMATGWLNFRARAMLVSVASRHLELDWRATGHVLARRFADYEPGIHWPQMQMQAGTTGINRPRIYNPVKQGLDHDPDGAFTRAWVPELALVPDAHLHAPWRWTGAGAILGRSYPEPLVDPATAARAARAAVSKARADPGFTAEAARIVTRHASRAAPRTGRTGPQRPAAKTPATLQLSLDL